MCSTKPTQKFIVFPNKEISWMNEASETDWDKLRYGTKNATWIDFILSFWRLLKYFLGKFPA